MVYDLHFRLKRLKLLRLKHLKSNSQLEIDKLENQLKYNLFIIYLLRAKNFSTANNSGDDGECKFIRTSRVAIIDF